MPEGDAELVDAVAKFMWAVEMLLGRDWAYSRSMMLPFNGMIADDGTFLEPGVEDETEDWGHRAIFLDRYRELRRLMRERGIEPQGLQ